MGYLMVALGVIAGVVAIVALLRRATAQGGQSTADAQRTATQVLAEADAFRGSKSDGSAQWDGERRLARPEDGELGLPGLSV
jgi:hypothetical protein